MSRTLMSSAHASVVMCFLDAVASSSVSTLLIPRSTRQCCLLWFNAIVARASVDVETLQTDIIVTMYLVATMLVEREGPGNQGAGTNKAANAHMKSLWCHEITADARSTSRQYMQAFIKGYDARYLMSEWYKQNFRLFRTKCVTILSTRAKWTTRGKTKFVKPYARTYKSLMFLFILVHFWNFYLISPNSTWLVMSWHDTFEVSSPCILAVSSLSNSTARHTRNDERDRRDSQLSSLCNMYKIMITIIHLLLNVSITNLLELTYTFISFISFDGTNGICVCKSTND